ncbi:flagellar biosynthetic protein FlhF [Spongiibacter sp. IMCC21906]|uniref:flagellar biosynthesis protein FlhF n=1 Tax=Spongiibacter sp. IMCC21906 TaxID=1620392 RepID=UPI00062DFF5C|nr:flagellar biosynthesis protein FlhF [Spongiibacter sp. IMCC21906]AKH69397.1 flagellar biosynthetic protein FlhF [Spongiibacter sp. IMCC21906]
MNVKKYRAADTRQAMKMVKAAHGPDAVVLDCYSIDGGVEMVVSWEDAELSQAAVTSELSAVDVLRARQEAAKQAPTKPQTETGPSQGSGAGPKVVWSQDDELLTMKKELASMKTLLMAQLKGHSWKDADHQVPEQCQLNQFMAAMDIDPELGRKLAEQIPSDEEDSIQREIFKMLLSRNLPVIAPPSSGAIALVGPQGSGKTTTIAKLAAQHVLTHGKDSVAILSTDNARVGAQEQLRAYGSILQVPVHCADSPDEAAKIYRVLRKKTLLLVDTAGVSFRDRQGLQQLEALLSVMPDVSVYLNIPADGQSHVQKEIIQAYQPLNIQAAVVSRIDEATRLGGVISNLIDSKLPAAWFSNGPNVPRNLSKADAGKLVKMAVRMSTFFERNTQATPATDADRQRVSALG